MNNTTKALLIISGALLLIVATINTSVKKTPQTTDPAHSVAVPARKPPVKVDVCVRSWENGKRHIVCRTLQMGMSLAEVEALLPESHARTLDTVTTGADGTQIALRLFFSPDGYGDERRYVSMTFYNDQLAQVSQ
jgi:hypothetical protein